MAGSVGQGQHRGLEGVEWSEGRSGFLAGDRCRRRNIWLRRAEFRLAGSGLPGSGSPGSGSTGSDWGDADWEKLWGTNDFPRRVSLGSGFPVALLDGDDAEVSSSEDSKGARIVHHDLLLSSGGFFAREVRVPDTSSASGGRSDADAGDTAEVAPEKEVLVRKTRASLSRQSRQSPPPSVPPVLDVSGLGGEEVRMQQRLVLTDSHLSATDADTVLAGGAVDPAKITFRITAITGGKLQRLSSSGAWEDMGLATGAAYYAFTLADLQAGKIAFLAGDGVASADGGEGKQITFKVQAADDGPHLSDSDDATPGDQPADGTIAVDRAAVAVTARVGGPINEDGVLTPDPTMLRAWKQSATAHGGTLHLVVKLQDKESGDALSLRGNYDTSKITPLGWDAESGELSLQISSGATAAEIGTALKRLWLEPALSASDGTRQVWVFPTLSGVAGLVYRVDEAAGLVRYYFYDSTDRTFAAASTEAAERSFFGKSGYLGVPTSDADRSVYKLFYDLYGEKVVISIWRLRTPWRRASGWSRPVPGKDSFFGITQNQKVSSVLERQALVGMHRMISGLMVSPTIVVALVRTKQGCRAETISSTFTMLAGNPLVIMISGWRMGRFSCVRWT